MSRVLEFFVYHQSKPATPLFSKDYVGMSPKVKEQFDAELVMGAVSTAEVCLGDFGVSANAGCVKAFETDDYKLHHLSTATGYRFVLMTDPRVRTDVGQRVLEQVYRRAFVEVVAEDPSFRHAGAQAVANPAFESRIGAIFTEHKLSF